jgi:hypothetical protein
LKSPSPDGEVTPQALSGTLTAMVACSIPGLARAFRDVLQATRSKAENDVRKFSVMPWFAIAAMTSAITAFIRSGEHP